MTERKTICRPAYDAFMKVYPFTLDDLDGEIWKDFNGYHVSNFGRVKSFGQGKPRILKPAINHCGYLRVCLVKNGKQKSISVHRLVALTFIPNPDSKPEVNHKDGFKFNNHVSNLEWATRSEANCHAVATGLMPQGQDRSDAKLTNEQAKFIRENPEGLNTYELAEMFGVAPTTIGAIQLGKSYKTAGGSIRQPNRNPLKVSMETRAQIRAEYKAGVFGCGAHVLAKKYGVAPMTIWSIVNENKR